MVTLPSKPRSIIRRLLPLIVLVALAPPAIHLTIYVYKWRTTWRIPDDFELDFAPPRDAKFVLSVDNPPSPDSFYPMQVLPPLPVVSGISILSADEATAKIEGDELVIGVTVNGESRAYPINVMTGPSREIFNDKLGGRSIAATW